MPPHPWARSPTIRQAAGLGLAVVGLDQATKLAATLAAVGQTSGLVVPVHNPHFSLGLAGAPLPVMALLMAAGILAAGGYSLHAAHRRRLPAWVPGLLVGGPRFPGHPLGGHQPGRPGRSGRRHWFHPGPPRPTATRRPDLGKGGAP